MRHALPAAVAVALLSLWCAPVLAQTALPNSKTALECRADNTFDRGDYTGALVMYRRLAARLTADPRRLALIEQRIRMCEQKLATVAATQPAAASARRGIRVPHTRPPEGAVLELPIKELGNFPYDGQTLVKVPTDVLALNGVQFRTHGYMMPIDQADQMTQFGLVSSLLECCFGLPPGIQHIILVRCPAEKAVPYYNGEIIVEGTLRVEETREEGAVVSLFQLDCKSVKPAAK